MKKDEEKIEVGRVKVGFTLKRKQALLLKILAKNFVVTKGELIGYLLDNIKKDQSLRNKIRTEIKKNRESEEDLIKKIEEL